MSDDLNKFIEHPKKRSESEKILELRVYSVFKNAGFGVEF